MNKGLTFRNPRFPQLILPPISLDFPLKLMVPKIRGFTLLQCACERDRGVVGSASGYEPGGRGFDPCRSRIFFSSSITWLCEKPWRKKNSSWFSLFLFSLKIIFLFHFFFFGNYTAFGSHTMDGEPEEFVFNSGSFPLVLLTELLFSLVPKDFSVFNSVEFSWNFSSFASFSCRFSPPETLGLKLELIWGAEFFVTRANNSCDKNRTPIKKVLTYCTGSFPNWKKNK